ncbi:MAG: aminopeptidase, partial [Clostridia bacterium]|nr:aminopeptidase [Clostridia bacterium]
MTPEEIKELKDRLLYKKTNAYEVMTEENKAEMEGYIKGYMSFLDKCKTEREAVLESIKLAKEKNFVEYNFGDKIVKGGKYYYNNRGKELILFTIGSEDVENGIRISAAHIDSPRLDLKPHPIYEE